MNDIVGRPTYFFNNRFSIRVYNLYESVREKNVERSLLKTTFFDSTYDSYIYIRRIFFEIYVRRVRVKRKWWTEFIDGRKELSSVNKTGRLNKTVRNCTTILARKKTRLRNGRRNTSRDGLRIDWKLFHDRADPTRYACLRLLPMLTSSSKYFFL